MRLFTPILILIAVSIIGCAAAPTKTKSADGCWLHIAHSGEIRNLLSVCIDGPTARSFIFYANTTVASPPTICRHRGRVEYTSPGAFRMEMNAGPCENSRVFAADSRECTIEDVDTLICSDEHHFEIELRRDHDRLYIDELGHRLMSMQPSIVKAWALTDEKQWEAAQKEFYPLAMAGQVEAIYGLGFVLYYLGNKAESFGWISYAAMLGEILAIDYLGELAPRVVHFEQRLEDQLEMCSLVLESVGVLPNWRVFHFRIQNESMSRKTMVVVQSAYAHRSDQIFLHGLHQLQEIYIPYNGRFFFSVLVSGSNTNQLQLEVSCDAESDVFIIPFHDPRTDAEDAALTRIQDEAKE